MERGIELLQEVGSWMSTLAPWSLLHLMALPLFISVLCTIDPVGLVRKSKALYQMHLFYIRVAETSLILSWRLLRVL